VSSILIAVIPWNERQNHMLDTLIVWKYSQLFRQMECCFTKNRNRIHPEFSPFLRLFLPLLTFVDVALMLKISIPAFLLSNIDEKTLFTFFSVFPSE